MTHIRSESAAGCNDWRVSWAILTFLESNDNDLQSNRYFPGVVDPSDFRLVLHKSFAFDISLQTRCWNPERLNKWLGGWINGYTKHWVIKLHIYKSHQPGQLLIGLSCRSSRLSIPIEYSSSYNAPSWATVNHRVGMNPAVSARWEKKSNLLWTYL